MLQLFLIAFTIGMAGSMHCLGMCGPLALSLPLKDQRSSTRIIGGLIYNSGRIVTYSILGAVLGSLGQAAAFFGFQQVLSIIMGLLIILFIVVPVRWNFIQKTPPFINNFFFKVRSLLATLFNRRDGSSLFLIGLLNGLLPCGLVYMAIAGALATANVESSMLFMAAFGAGTLPMMWLIVFFGKFSGAGLRKGIRRIYPYIMACMACLLILRGLGLGIPYISPRIGQHGGAQAVECRVKQ